MADDQRVNAQIPSPYNYQPTPTGNQRIDQIHMTTLCDLDADAGASGHPGMTDGFAADCAESEDGLTAYSTGRSLLRDLYVAKKNLSKAVKASEVETVVGKSANGQLQYRREIPAAVKAELAASAASSFQGISGRNDRALRAVEGSINQIDATIANALKPTDKSAVQGLGEYVRSLPVADRFKFMEQQVREGNHRLISSFLSDSPFLSGLNQAQAAAIKQMAEAKFAGPACRARSGALKMHRACLDAGHNYVTHYKKMLPTVTPTKRELAIQALRGK